MLVMLSSLPDLVRERCCSVYRERRLEREEESVERIVSRPETSICRNFSSCAPGSPRSEPTTRPTKPVRSDGEEAASDCLRWRARTRLCFVESISSVAASPASLREISDSRIVRCRTPKVCHKEDTAAKPARAAIRDIPMIPILSRHASVKEYFLGSVDVFCFPRKDFRKIDA